MKIGRANLLNEQAKRHNHPQGFNKFSRLEKNTGSKKQRVFKETKTALSSLLSLAFAQSIISDSVVLYPCNLLVCNDSVLSTNSDAALILNDTLVSHLSPVIALRFSSLFFLLVTFLIAFAYYFTLPLRAECGF
jgi:hypothetical protein